MSVRALDDCDKEKMGLQRDKFQLGGIHQTSWEIC